MSSDLARERAQASFAPLDLTCFLRGGLEAVNRRRLVLQRVAADPVLGRGRLDDSFLSRAERYEQALKRMRRVHELGLTTDETFISLRLFREGGALEKAGGFGLHTGMFIPAIELLGTDAQRSRWLPMARSCAIIGTYAQTEMAHGTNLARLETVANFDPATDEFEIHSPTLTSTKWWPGGLGKCCTHALVLARLVTPDGEDRGQQPFVVQLRDLRTHLPVKGVELGDIGPKMGYDRVDNGYLRLDRVRVPRDHMLARHAQVGRDGSFAAGDGAGNSRAVYGPMMLIRVYLVEESSLALQHATTVATRYSAVRRQGGGGPSAPAASGQRADLPEAEARPERQVLDYQTQQTRLLPLVASAYALHFAAVALRGRYDHFRATGDASQLSELHATSAALKSFGTSVAASGVETCRLLCGGHGYSMASGLPGLYAEFTPSQTYEGDNVVMLLQTARWIVKQLAAGATADPTRPSRTQPSTPSPAAGAQAGGAGSILADPGAYLRAAGSAPNPRSVPFAGAPADIAGVRPESVLAALEEAARVAAVRAAGALQTHFAAGAVPYEVAWSERASAELVTAARAHARFLLAKCFHAAVADAQRARAPPPAALASLARVRSLHLAWALADESTLLSLLESGYFTPAHTAAARAAALETLPGVRRDAVALVDAFGLSDLELNSVLGRWDGDVYPHLLDWARRSPLNDRPVVNGFEEHVRPIMGKCKL